MNKCTLLTTKLTNVLGKYDTYTIKSTIGDSVYNHRTPTVRQVIRFLTASNSWRLRKLGRNLETAYKVTYPKVLGLRSVTNDRTDAVDINEFLYTFGVYTNDTGFTRNLGRKLTVN